MILHVVYFCVLGLYVLANEKSLINKVYLMKTTNKLYFMVTIVGLGYYWD